MLCPKMFNQVTLRLSYKATTQSSNYQWLIDTFNFLVLMSQFKILLEKTNFTIHFGLTSC